MALKIVPDLVHSQTLSILSPASTARAAAKVMAERHIGAVLVAEAGTLVGICTERDIAYKVVAGGRDADATTLAEIMTPEPAVIGPGDKPGHALDLMQEYGCRHLPVVEGGRILGMLSIRDLYAALHAALEDDVRARDAYIAGAAAGYTMS